MSRKTTSSYKTPEWLIKHGCAYDVLEPGRRAEPDPVEIRIDPAPQHKLLFRIGDGGQPAFFLWAEIAARKAVIHMSELMFELCDAPDIQFELLPCPTSPPEPYQFSGGEFQFPQESVLNRVIPGRICQNYPVEGFVMGVALQQLPAGLHGLVAARLILLNEFGEVARAQFDIPLDPKKHVNRSIGHRTKGVFEPDDDEPQVTPRMPWQRTPPASPGLGDLTASGTTPARTRPAQTGGCGRAIGG